MFVMTRDAKEREALFQFIKNYMETIVLQLEGARSGMSQAVAKIMTVVGDINEVTEKGRQEVESLLDQVYFNTASAASAQISDVQDDVDRIFAEAQASSGGTASDSDQDLAKRRAAGLFSKSSEAVSFLANELTTPLLTIAGILSSEDVVSQRIDNAIRVIRKFCEESSLANVSLSEPKRSDDIRKVGMELIRFAKNQSKTIDETNILSDVFGKHSEKLLVGGNSLAGIEQDFLLHFIGRFHLVLSRWMEIINRQISETLEVAMADIMKISELVAERVKHARTIVVGNQTGTGLKFQNKVLDEIHAGNATSESSILKQSQAVLADLDQKVNEQVMAMMGELSIEDVVSQRLKNVEASLRDIEELMGSLSGVKAQTHSSIPPKATGVPVNAGSLKPLLDGALRRMYGRYKMEPEKMCFIKVFGRAPMSTAA